MSRYEDALMKTNNVKIYDKFKLPGEYEGWYQDNYILIDRTLPTRAKTERLAEELAHHKLTYGDITDQSKFNNRKFEGYARRYAMEKMISLQDIISAFKHGCHNLYTTAEFFEVTESYVKECLSNYKRKYGIYARCGNYVIQFDPLGVFEYKNIK